MNLQDAREALAHFVVPGSQVRLEPLTQGLINKAFRVFVGGEPLYVLQRINTDVFVHPDRLMGNMTYLLPYLKGEGYREVGLRQTREGAPYLTDRALGVWRLFDYIPGSMTVEHTQSPETARETGRILGRFHQLVSGAQLAKLQHTLPRFHDLTWRIRQFEEALAEGIPGRIEMAGALIRKVSHLRKTCGEIPFSRLPERICHNDTKLSNFLFDTTSGQALCLIDLDTLMPGYLLYDFGDVAYDLTRSATTAASSPGYPHMDLQMLGAFVRGLRESGLVIHREELEWLPHSLVLMPFLHGIRALSDYLVGDRYYRITYPEQNLDRARDLLLFSEGANGRLPEISNICKKRLG